MKNSIWLPFFHLIAKDFSIFSKGLKGKLLESIFSIATLLVVFKYFLPQLGLQKECHLIIVVGAIAAIGFYEMVGHIASFIADIEGDRTISYFLTIPIPSFLAINSIPIGWAVFGSILTTFLWLIFKIFFFPVKDLLFVSSIQSILMIVTINLFFGYFSLFLASLVKNVKNTGWLWVRIVNPMYLLGCYFCPWHVLHSVSISLGYVSLLNPMTYIMEGMRSITLGQEGYIPFGICLGTLWCFIPLLAWISYFRLKKRLDCL